MRPSTDTPEITTFGTVWLGDVVDVGRLWPRHVGRVDREETGRRREPVTVTLSTTAEAVDGTPTMSVTFNVSSPPAGMMVC